MKNKGFTLLELTVVVAIIAIMATAITTFFIKWKNDNKEPKYYTDIVFPDTPNYKKILEDYGIDVSNLSDEEIRQLINEIRGENK